MKRLLWTARWWMARWWGAGPRMSDIDAGRRFWERHARGYDRSMSLFGGPLPRVRQLTVDAVAGAGRVLEVAAGTGLLTVAIAPRVGRLVATDYADAMIAVLEARVREAGLTNVECVHGDLRALPFPPGTFDAVVGANVLHLVPDLDEALAAMRRLVAPGGVVVTPTFCHAQTWTSALLSRALAAIGQPMHRRFTTAALADAIRRAGLTVTKTETVPGLVPVGYVEAVRGGD